ncbi:MAG TPA: hypothetical protein VLH38_04405 [Patescibacteria group bacterium]|nr:hypothetical protein [Patescibacteria group bacterium]
MGQYWDWSFPYFHDQIHNLFANQNSSWIQAKSGSPLGYSSDYFFRFFVGLFIFLQPETLHYLLLAGLFSVTAFGVYLLSRPYTSRWLAFLLGLAACINPAIFYKYTAGHFDYFLSFPLLIYMMRYLLRSFDRTLRSAIVVGIFMGFIGAQIQFFIIAGIFLLLFLIWNRDKVALKYLPVLFGIPVLINMVWLMNFIDGGASAAQTGATAAKVSFKASSASSFLNIFTFNFSQATLLSKFYAFYELLWNGALFVFLFWLLSNGKRKERFDIVLLVFLAVLIFLATGMYQVIALWPLNVLYPMLREVGHFAPVIVLIALLLISRLLQRTHWRWALLLVLVGSIFIVGVKFQYYSQSYSFATARQQFAPFKQLADRDPSNYRVLAYPFFDKYLLKNEPADPEGQFPLKNSGHDSFAAFASQAFLQNDVAPYQFQDSVQNRLLQTYNVDVLRPYNVKYIFDFSSFYTSNYNFYVPAATYNGDLSLIKNDPHFFDKLLAHNPGRLRRVGDHVLEVTDFMPRVAATENMFSGVSADQASDAAAFTRQELGHGLSYIDDNSAAKSYTTQITNLFSGNAANLNKVKQTFSQAVRVPTHSSAKLYVNQSYRTLTYSATASMLTLYAEPVPPLLINGQPAGSLPSQRQVVGIVPLNKGVIYYVSIAGTLQQIHVGQGTLGAGKAGDIVEVLNGQSANLLANSSFESGLWEQRVGDCNDYDNNGKVAMARTVATASDGKASLELNATRHTACTSQTVQLAAATQYAFSFDYQSANAQTASFYIGSLSGGVPLGKGSRAITDEKWHTSTMLFTPAKTEKARIFLYALEGDGAHATINHYDNLSLMPLQPLTKLTVPAATRQYTETALTSGDQVFTFKDPNYNYQNLIANPSFEQGGWQAKVGDCNNYDGLPKLGMRLDAQDKTNGSQSLELSAGHHDACVHTTANVVAGADYALHFDYEVLAGQSYGYAVSYDDPGATLSRDQLDSIAAGGWHTANITLHIPQRTTTMTVYLYAFESSDRTTNIVRYDNVSLVQLPNLSARFYVVQQPLKPMHAPRQLTSTLGSQSVRTIHVRGATTPFFVELSETYHPQWRLELNNSSVDGLLNGWLPSASAFTSGVTHGKVSGVINGWLVDPAILCGQGGGNLHAGCSRNTDGSYSLELKAEFVPHRWFGIATFISWLTVVSAGAYLILVRPKKQPTYRRHP